MTQFKVALSELRTMVDQLERLRVEFDELEATVAGYREAVGSDEVADELEAFGSNWSRKRGEIVQLIANVATYARMAEQGYSAVEASLAAQLSADGDPTPRPRPAP